MVGAIYANGDTFVWDTMTGAKISETFVRNVQQTCRVSAWGSWAAVLCDIPYENFQGTFAEVWYLHLEGERPTGHMFRSYDPHGELAVIPESGQAGWLAGDAAAGTQQMETWDLVNGTQVGASGVSPAIGPGRFAFGPGTEVSRMVMWTESTLQLWNDGELLFEAQNRVAGVSSLAFEPWEGEYVLALGREDGRLELWSLALEERFWDVQAHEGAVTGLAFSPDAHSLASAGQDGQVVVWNLTIGEQAAAFDLSSYGALSGLAYSPDGQKLAAAAEDALLLDVDSGAILATLDAHSRVAGLAFSPDGSVVVTFSEDGTVEMWQAADGAQLASLELLASPPGGAAFSPDLCVVAYGVEPAGSIEWWDMIDSRTMQVYEQQEVVTALAFSLDGRLLAVGSENGTALIWGLAGALEAKEGEPVSTYCGGVAP